MAQQNNAQSSETLEQMLTELEQSGTLYVEWAKTDIAEHICSAMRRESVSKADLARRLGSSRAYVTQMLQGSVNFTIESLVKIATVLSCELEIKFQPKSAVGHWHFDIQKEMPSELPTWDLKSDTQFVNPSFAMNLEDEDNAFLSAAA